MDLFNWSIKQEYILIFILNATIHAFCQGKWCEFKIYSLFCKTTTVDYSQHVEGKLAQQP